MLIKLLTSRFYPAISGIKQNLSNVLAFVLMICLAALIVQINYYHRSPTYSLNQNLDYPKLSFLPSPTPRPIKKPALVQEVKAQESSKSAQPQVIYQGELIPILMYHYVGLNPNPKDHARDILSVTPDKFETQLAYLKSQGYQSITLDQLYNHLINHTQIPPKSIILTFDDGYSDFYFNAYPILLKYNFKAVSLIPTNLMDKPAYMSWSQVQSLAATGNVEFIAHSQNHSQLTTLTFANLDQELTGSKQTLSEKLGQKINYMGYPYGASDNRVIQQTQKAGYLMSLGTWQSKYQSSQNLLNLPRMRVTGNMDLELFKTLL